LDLGNPLGDFRIDGASHLQNELVFCKAKYKLIFSFFILHLSPLSCNLVAN
jgi:hypothetical protein